MGARFWLTAIAFLGILFGSLLISIGVGWLPGLYPGGVS